MDSNKIPILGAGIYGDEESSRFQDLGSGITLDHEDALLMSSTARRKEIIDTMTS